MRPLLELDSSTDGKALVSIQLDANTVDGRGQATDEALSQVNAGLDLVAHSVLFLVHGVGSGRLRSKVHQFSSTPCAMAKVSLEMSLVGGCTVVHLK